jgi:hypothetical protein
VEYAGAGEMGKIMLDFTWNAIMNGKGYAELGKPMYDQKMWREKILGMDAPRLMDVTAVVAEIAGKFLPGMQFADDLIFAGLDITQGYKSVGEVAQGLAKKALVQVATLGDGAVADKLDTAVNMVTEKFGVVGKFIADTGKAAAEKYADTGKANKLWLKTEVVSASLQSGAGVWINKGASGLTNYAIVNIFTKPFGYTPAFDFYKMAAESKNGFGLNIHVDNDGILRPKPVWDMN